MPSLKDYAAHIIATEKIEIDFEKYSKSEEDKGGVVRSSLTAREDSPRLTGVGVSSEPVTIVMNHCIGTRACQCSPMHYTVNGVLQPYRLRSGVQ